MAPRYPAPICILLLIGAQRLARARQLQDVACGQIVADGYDTDKDGYADFDLWLQGADWTNRLAAVARQTAPKKDSNDEGCGNLKGMLNHVIKTNGTTILIEAIENQSISVEDNKGSSCIQIENCDNMDSMLTTT